MREKQSLTEKQARWLFQQVPLLPFVIITNSNCPKDIYGHGTRIAKEISTALFA
jgi:hypothetical protein